MKYKAVLIQS